MGWRNVTWVCPYFHYDEKLLVACEGGTRIKFDDIQTLRQYEDAHCCSMDGYHKCSVAQALEEKYREEDKD